MAKLAAPSSDMPATGTRNAGEALVTLVAQVRHATNTGAHPSLAPVALIIVKHFIIHAHFARRHFALGECLRDD